MKISISHFILRIISPLLFVLLSSNAYAAEGDISTTAVINNPYDVAFDSSGNMYVADSLNDHVYKVAPNGSQVRFAGVNTGTNLGDFGLASVAYLDDVWGVHVDKDDNVYISTNSRIRKVDTSGIITTFAGTGVTGYSGDAGQATLARINRPRGMTSDSAGNLYFADRNNERVRKILPNGIITTVAGTGAFGFSGDGGPATAAQLDYPWDVELDSSGNLYISDQLNNRIRKVTNGFISTFHTFNFNTYGIDIDGVDNVYVGHAGHQVVKVDQLHNQTTLVGSTAGYSGDGGSAVSAQINNPYGIEIDSSGNLLIADYSNGRVREIVGSATIIDSVYRLYNPNNGEHLYTTYKLEYDSLGPIGWIQEDVGFKGLNKAATVSGTTATPWLRVFNPNSGLHHWTTSLGEYNSLGAIGWNQEGATSYIFETLVAGTVVLYRLYNPNDGTHHWTLDEAEKDMLDAIGWVYEGIAGYVYPK